MNNSKLAIVIELSQNTKNVFIKCLKELKKKLDVKKIYLNSPCPHMNLVHNFKLNKINIKNLKGIIKSFANDSKQFQLTAIGIGIFISKTPVIHIRWSLNRSLISLISELNNRLSIAFKKNLITGYLENQRWQPVTTLAFDDTNYKNMVEIIRIIKRFKLKKYSLTINNLALYEYSKKYGDKKIQSYKIN